MKGTLIINFLFGTWWTQTKR